MKFTPYVYRVESARVIDGDTVALEIDLGFRLGFSINVRLSGVNAPESKGAEKPAGLVVKAFTEKWVADRASKLLVRSMQLDKYADRVVGDLVCGNESLTEALKAKNYVTPVSADGTVTKFTQQHLDAIVRGA